MLSGFGARTLNVAAHPSNFSTLNTLEHSHRFVFDSCGLLHVVVKSLQIGIVQGTPLGFSYLCIAKKEVIFPLLLYHILHFLLLILWLSLQGQIQRFHL